MYQFPIGVLLESFRLGVIESLDRAQALGMQGVQVRATFSEITPETMTPEKCREFLKNVQDRGLTISALCGDLGEGFSNPDKNPALIEQSKRIMDLAKQLGTDVVTTHIGVVPSDPTDPRYAIMQDACGQLAAYADSMEGHFAIETGPETAPVLKNFLDGLYSTGVAVNLDPANFVMVTGDDPVEAVHTLKDYIVHTHAKDGRRLRYVDPEVLYGMAESDMLQDPSFIELPLGQGDVDFPAYLKALDDIGYRGFLTIEREVGDDPAADIALAVKFLREKIG